MIMFITKTNDMLYRLIFFSLLLQLATSSLAAQEVVAEIEVIQTIQQFFDGMRSSDTSLIRSTLHPSARLQTTFTDAEGKPQLRLGSIESFLNNVGSPRDEIYDERIWSYHVQLEDNLATAWTPYSFFVGDTFSHCGVNAFQFARTEAGWQIIQITDTRRKEGCRME